MRCTYKHFLPAEVEVFRLPLEGGFIQYNHYRDMWTVWSEKDGRIDDINANHFKTIKEFKQWGQAKING